MISPPISLPLVLCYFFWKWFKCSLKPCMWLDPFQSHSLLWFCQSLGLLHSVLSDLCKAPLPWGRTAVHKNCIYNHPTKHCHRICQDHLFIFLLFLYHHHHPPPTTSTPLQKKMALRWIALLPYPAGRILAFLGVTKNHIPFCPEEKKKAKDASLIMQTVYCNTAKKMIIPISAISYSWHLSKSSGHAYPSAFREVSMCKHPFTIFRVMLKLFMPACQFIQFVILSWCTHVYYWSFPFCIVF